MNARVGALAALAASAIAAAAPRPEIAVVKSENLAPYTRLVAGFTAESKAEIVEYDLKGSEEHSEKVFAAVKRKKPSLVLAIGPLAANGARRALADLPVLFAMVPNYEKYGLEAKNVTGIALSPGIRFQLQALKAVLPKVESVGVVFNPKYSQTVVDGAAADAESLGMSVARAKIESPDDVGRALESLAGKADALWMLADRTVAHETAAQKLIEFSIERKLPLLALSDGQVKDGALLSLSPNHAAMGQQAGRLANRIVYEKIDPGAIAVQQPEGIDIAVNLTTSRKLGAGCDIAVDVLKFASKNGYSVKVFE